MKSVKQQYKNVHIRNAKPGEVDPSQAIKVNSVEEYQNVLKNLSSSQKYTVSTMPVAISKSNTNSVKLDEVSDIGRSPIGAIA